MKLLAAGVACLLPVVATAQNVSLTANTAVTFTAVAGAQVQTMFDSAINDPGLIVLGLSPQPVVLNLLPNAACVLMPSPDALLLALPQSTTTLVVPPAARPVQIWTQGVGLFAGLLTTNAFQVTAL